jgi:hypothetical protein
MYSPSRLVLALAVNLLAGFVCTPQKMYEALPFLEEVAVLIR